MVKGDVVTSSTTQIDALSCGALRSSGGCAVGAHAAAAVRFLRNAPLNDIGKHRLLIGRAVDPMCAAKLALVKSGRIIKHTRHVCYSRHVP